MRRPPDRGDSPDAQDAGSHTSSGESPDDEETPPQRQLRWVQVRDPRRAVEIGPNGRVLASHFHEGYDAWEVLLETYEGET